MTHLMFYISKQLVLPYMVYCVPVAQWQSIVLAAQKVVGSIPRKHTYWQK